MSLGTGIFLAALCLSLVYLYKITMDRLPWAKILKRFLRLTAIIALLGLIVVGIIGINEYINSLDKKPYKITSYAGISLGMNMDEVQYIKGIPNYVLGEMNLQKSPNQSANDTINIRHFFPIYYTNELPKGTKFQDYKDWSYEYQNNGNLNIKFDNDKKVASISCNSNALDSEKSYWSSKACLPLFGIQDGTTEASLLKKFGKPSSEIIHGSTKTIYYEKWHIRFYLKQEEVYNLGIGFSKN